jgi:hypothetical protein
VDGLRKAFEYQAGSTSKAESRETADTWAGRADIWSIAFRRERRNGVDA